MAGETAATTTTSTTQTDQAATTAATTQTQADTTAASTSVLNEPAAKTAEAKPAGAPESYTDFTVPDGFTLDAAVSKEAGEMFKGMGLDQTQAQALVDFYVAKTSEAAQAPFKAFRDMQDGWANDLKSDPEIGGKLDQVKTTVSKAIDSLLTPAQAKDFRQAMDDYGMGSNPAFVRAFYALAQKVTEGGAVRAGGPVGQNAPGAVPVSAAKALYPNLS